MSGNNRSRLTCSAPGAERRAARAPLDERDVAAARRTSRSPQGLAAGDVAAARTLPARTRSIPVGMSAHDLDALLEPGPQLVPDRGAVDVDGLRPADEEVGPHDAQRAGHRPAGAPQECEARGGRVEDLLAGAVAERQQPKLAAAARVLEREARRTDEPHPGARRDRLERVGALV